MTDTTAPPALDLTLGERDATTCATCNRHLPPLPQPRFELETADTAQPLCDVCANRQHHGLRLAVALLNAILDAHTTGNKQQAQETLRAVVSGIEMLEETAAPVPYRRPVRRQPTRSTRRGRRRS